MGGRHLCVCLYVILLGVSGVAELSGPDPKMNNDGEGDDVWVELLPVQLVDTHRARFLEGRKKASAVSHDTVQTHSHSYKAAIIQTSATNMWNNK